MKNRKEVGDIKEIYYIVRKYELGILKEQFITTKDRLLTSYKDSEYSKEIQQGMDYGFIEFIYCGQKFASIKEINMNLL